MRPVLLASLALLVGSTATVPAVADPGHERPRITVMRWKEPPVTTGSGE